MKLTKGQKNELRLKAWIERQNRVEKLTGRKVVQTLKAGANSSWSFRPGGEGLGFDSPENVIEYLEKTFLTQTT